MRKVKCRAVLYKHDLFMNVMIPSIDKEKIFEGLFHEWSFDKEGPVGIVETYNGDIEIVRATNIKFLPKEVSFFDQSFIRPTSNTSTERTKKQGI